MSLLCKLLGETQTKDFSLMDFTKKETPKRDLKGFAEWLKWHQANNNIFIKVKNI